MRFEQEFDKSGLEPIALTVIGVFERMLITPPDITIGLIDFVQGKCAASEALRLGVECIVGGYSDAAIAAVLDAFMLIRVNSGGLCNSEVAGLVMVKSLAPLMRSHDVGEFSHVLKCFCASPAVVEALGALLGSFEYRHEYKWTTKMFEA